MASVMGAHAVAELIAGKSSFATGVVDGKVASLPFKNIIGKIKPPDMKMLQLAEILAS
jgi:hypothetical protein